MSYTTDYDRKRFQLKKELETQLEFVREELLSQRNSGYSEMQTNYAIDIYKKLADLIYDI